MDEKDLKDLLEVEGKKIGYVLGELKIPEESKDIAAYAATKSDSLEELMYISQKLEAMLVVQKSIESDETYQEEIKEIDQKASQKIQDFLTKKK